MPAIGPILEDFSRNSAKIWNAAPMTIKNAKSLAIAKKGNQKTL